MKSIKPGRGPSGMSFVGSIIAIIFGVFWTITAASLTANSPFGAVTMIFPLFGVLFIVFGIIQAAYNYKNATSKNRYSILDITDSSEEGDPSDKWIRSEKETEENTKQKKPADTNFKYCPYCGVQLKSDYVFCPECGKTL